MGRLELHLALAEHRALVGLRRRRSVLPQPLIDSLAVARFECDTTQRVASPPCRRSAHG
jgi:hypothetical protein